MHCLAVSSVLFKSGAHVHLNDFIDLLNALIICLYLRGFFINLMVCRVLQSQTCIGFLVVLCFVSYSQALIIDCKTLHVNLSSFIAKETGSETELDKINCEMQLIQTFADNMFIDGVQALASGDNSALVINDVVLTDARVRDWLVYAFLGKHFVDDGPDGDKHFTYVESTGQVNRNLLRCEFQQTLYLTLIVILILMLVFVLVFDARRRGAEGSGDAALKEQRGSENGMGGSGQAVNNVNPEINGRSKLNFRIPYTINPA